MSPRIRGLTTKTGKSGAAELAREVELERHEKQRTQLTTALDELNVKIGKLEKGEKLPEKKEEKKPNEKKAE